MIVSKDRDPDIVKESVIQALNSAFSFDTRQFGQPISKSEIIKVMQEVDGVLASDVDYLYLSKESKANNGQMLPPSEISDLLILNPDSGAVNLEVSTR